jgi:hypothetical protein
MSGRLMKCASFFQAKALEYKRAMDIKNIVNVRRLFSMPIILPFIIIDSQVIQINKSEAVGLEPLQRSRHTEVASEARIRSLQTLAIWGGAFSALHACVSGYKIECYHNICYLHRRFLFAILAHRLCPCPRWAHWKYCKLSPK